jgi:hypothetical protein
VRQHPAARRSAGDLGVPPRTPCKAGTAGAWRHQRDRLPAPLGLIVGAEAPRSGSAPKGALLAWALTRDHRPEVPAEQEATAEAALTA